jgi:hypothetical protein
MENWKKKPLANERGYNEKEKQEEKVFVNGKVAQLTGKEKHQYTDKETGPRENHRNEDQESKQNSNIGDQWKANKKNKKEGSENREEQDEHRDMQKKVQKKEVGEGGNENAKRTAGTRRKTGSRREGSTTK